MSSGFVRNAIMTYLKANWTTTPVFNLSDYLGRKTLDLTNITAWVGVQFLDSNEDFAGISNLCYREEGVVVIHVVHAAGRPSSEAINLCDQIRTLFRGNSLGNGTIYIMSIDPPTDQKGEAIEFDGNWHGFAMYMSLYRDFGI